MARPHVSPRGARILACRVAIPGDIASTLYGEYGKRAQRNNALPIAGFDRQVVRSAC